MTRQIWAVLCISLLTICTGNTDENASSAESEVRAAAEDNRAPLFFDGRVFSGPAWEILVAEGSGAQFFLVGEEHGIAENPQLVAQLFNTFFEFGYTKLAIETSPTMAFMLDDALARDGLDGLRTLYAQPGGEPAFFGMAEEAQMLASIKNDDARGEVTFWGTDYEVASDRQLLKLLANAEKPPEADRALKALMEASAASWQKHAQTGSPRFIFSFSGDPDLVRSLKQSWPDPDPRSAVILNTLHKTLAINKLWVSGKHWESNRVRAQLQRENFLRYWGEAKTSGETPRVMAKFGASHIIRGLSQTAVFDLGTLLPELAAIEGGYSVSLLILPGNDTSIAALNPSKWSYEPREVQGGYSKGLSPVLEAVVDDQFTLFDLRALRPVVGMNRGELTEELFRVVHGFDLLLVMSGSTPSAELEHP